MGQTIDKSFYSERRNKERMVCDLPATVKCYDQQGREFSDEGRVLNLSASGLGMLTKMEVQKNTEVIVIIGIPTGSAKWGVSNLATKGNVIRSEIQSNENVSLGIKFYDYKFL